MSVDLRRHRSAGQVVADAVRLFVAHAPVFFVATLIVVAPVTILVDGVLGEQFADGFDANPPWPAFLVSLLLWSVVVPGLLIGVHTGALQDLATSIEPSVGGVLRRAVHLHPRMVPAMALYACGVALGLLLLIVPGIYLAVRWCLCGQAVAVDDERGPGALRASSRAVAGSWWRAFGVLVLLVLVWAVVALLPSIVAQALTGSGAAYVLLVTFGDTIASSVWAIGATLLFFGLRAEQASAEPPAAFLPPTAV